jgi:predicted esterase
MKQKLILSSILLCALTLTSFGQIDKLNTYEELDRLARKYFETGKVDSAVIVVEYARKKFPDHDQDATSKLNFLYSGTNLSKAMENWDYGLKKRYFVGLQNLEIDSLKNNPEFIRLVKLDKLIMDSLYNASHLNYEICLPENYSMDKRYPVLFVFHGDNWNIEISKRFLTSQIVKEKFITVYMQSYIFMTYKTFKWKLNDEKTNKEFKEIFEQILNKYPINKNQVIFTSMSSGGNIAIDFAFNQFVPVNGLVLTCPVVPDVSDSSVSDFVGKNKKIAIITGENDWAINDQKNLIHKIDKVGGNNKITIKPGMGHEIPNDYSTLLDQYLNWMLE